MTLSLPLSLYLTYTHTLPLSLSHTFPVHFFPSQMILFQMICQGAHFRLHVLPGRREGTIVQSTGVGSRKEGCVEMRPEARDVPPCRTRTSGSGAHNLIVQGAA